MPLAWLTTPPPKAFNFNSIWNVNAINYILDSQTFGFISIYVCCYCCYSTFKQIVFRPMSAPASFCICLSFFLVVLLQTKWYGKRQCSVYTKRRYELWTRLFDSTVHATTKKKETKKKPAQKQATNQRERTSAENKTDIGCYQIRKCNLFMCKYSTLTIVVGISANATLWTNISKFETTILNALLLVLLLPLCTIYLVCPLLYISHLLNCKCTRIQ